MIFCDQLNNSSGFNFRNDHIEQHQQRLDTATKIAKMKNLVIAIVLVLIFESHQAEAKVTRVRKNEI